MTLYLTIDTDMHTISATSDQKEIYIEWESVEFDTMDLDYIIKEYIEASKELSEDA